MSTPFPSLRNDSVLSSVFSNGVVTHEMATGSHLQSPTESRNHVFERKIFAGTREFSALALESILAHEAVIRAKWVRGMSDSGIEYLLELFPLKVADLSKSLRRMSYTAFRRRIQELG